MQSIKLHLTLKTLQTSATFELFTLEAAKCKYRFLLKNICKNLINFKDFKHILVASQNKLTFACVWLDAQVDLFWDWGSTLKRASGQTYTRNSLRDIREPSTYYTSEKIFCHWNYKNLREKYNCKFQNFLKWWIYIVCLYTYTYTDIHCCKRLRYKFNIEIHTKITKFRCMCIKGQNSLSLFSSVHIKFVSLAPMNFYRTGLHLNF